MKYPLVIAMFACLTANAAVVTSPDGKITAETGSGVTVSYCGETVLDIPVLGVAVNGRVPKPAEIIEVSGPTYINVDYTMPVGKASHCLNECNAYTLTCSDGTGIEMRLYDDGIALRYMLKGLDGDNVSDELTTYRIPDGTPRWTEGYNMAYEDFFPMTTTGDGKTRDWCYPALIQANDSAFVLISEADIRREHSASYLSNASVLTDYKVCFPANDVRMYGGWTSPWRVAIIGTLADVVESTLITDLSPAPSDKDTAWIKPGGVSWVYWAYNHGSNDYQIVKKYIDMARTLGLPYVLIDAEWDDMSNGGNIDDAISYANACGVKPLIWYNSDTGWLQKDGSPGPHNRLNDPADRRREFAEIAAKGVAGVKIDFFDGDKQPIMEYYIDILEDAASEHLLVNYHGATAPRGWQRTYPNLMSVEAVYGAEWYNNRPVLTDRAAAHNATLPFTRNVIGPMDYTPCTFSDSQHPHITSNAHELALPVIFESALLHWADKPESYLAQPLEVQAFIGSLPTVWDETRLMAGYPGEYVVMARRSGDTWYVAAINGLDTEQVIDVDWSAINLPQTYTAVTFADGSGTPWTISTRPSPLPDKIWLQPRGGYVAIIR